MGQALKDYPRSVWVKLKTESHFLKQHGREVENRRRQTYRAIDRLVEEGQLKAVTRNNNVWLEPLPKGHCIRPEHKASADESCVQDRQAVCTTLSAWIRPWYPSLANSLWAASWDLLQVIL